ncbi:MAG: exo-alpha-sialidase [Acidobacteria bacterium]|nr:exo-alpha-sialidase [Acidobacteriota bacterium]
MKLRVEWLLAIALLASCGSSEPREASAAAEGPEVIVSDVATPTPENPRNTEGDVVVLADGRLLVAWSDFYGGAEDHSEGRISARISDDGGRSWGERFVLQENVGEQNVMSTSLLRSKTSGDILLFYGVKNSKSDLHFWVRRSSDEAATWSEPTLVDAQPGYSVMNNDRVVQLADGRLLAPIAFTEEVFKPGTAFRTAVYYSDDDGRTWARSADSLEAPQRGAMEPGLVELADGRVLQIIRTQVGKIWHSYSSDRGESWSPAEPWIIPSPEAPATIVRLPDARLALFYNPVYVEGANHGGARTPLSVSLSSDEGRSWSAPQAIEDDPDQTFSYISVTPHEDRLLITYWVGQGRLYGLRFRSIPLAWFDAAP